MVDTPVPTPDACNGAQCDPPLRAGIDLWIGLRGYSCTSGFTTNPNTTGVRYIFSAGHCMSDGSTVDQSGGGRRVGYVSDSIYENRNVGGRLYGIDAARIFIQDSNYWRPANYAYWNSAAQLFQITSVAINNGAVGSYICRRGIASGTRCGDVVEQFATAGGDQRRQMRVAACSNGGDSGAAWYTRVPDDDPRIAQGRAYGIHSQSYAGPDYDCGGRREADDRSWVSPIWAIQQVHKLTVDTTP